MYLAVLLSTEGTKRNKIVSNLKELSVKRRNQTRKHFYHCVINIFPEEWKSNMGLRKKEYLTLPEEIGKGFSGETKLK